jgi:hypothetical protein
MTLLIVPGKEPLQAQYHFTGTRFDQKTRHGAQLGLKAHLALSAAASLAGIVNPARARRRHVQAW